MKITYTFIMKVLPALLAALCWTSCSDFLEEDPKGQLPSDTYFSNKEDLDASLTALYSVIASSQASNNLCGTNFLVGDDISTHPSSNKQPLREHDQFDVKDNNSWLSSMWEQRFKVIKAANFIINNAERTPEVSKEDIKVAIAQAHYWRAYSYFYLVTTWGRVPIMLKEEIDYNAVPKDLCYEDKWILSKLNELIKEATINLDNYDLGVWVQKTYDFIWGEFCDWYIEIVKPRLYNKECKTRKAAQYTLNKVLGDSLKLLHPIMPFVTEEIYTKLYNIKKSYSACKIIYNTR